MVDPAQPPVNAVVLPQTEDTTSPSSPNKWINIALYAVMAAVGILLIVIVVLLVRKPSTQPGTQTAVNQQVASIPAAVSGTIQLTGYVPSTATITISERLTGQGNYVPVVSGLPAVDGTTWTWNGALSGVGYDFQATIMLNGTANTISSPLTIAAPATNQVLVVNSTIPAPPSQAAISGTLDLNGYIPANATITIGEKIPGTADYTNITSGLAPVDGSLWTWNNALNGTQYEIRAFLIQNGLPIATSNKLVVDAPADSQVLSINSNATAPGTPTQVTMSGTIAITGPIPANSGISIATRPSGTTTFTTVATGLPATNGVAWNWNGGTTGTSYDVQATLQSANNVTATSNILTAIAPAANETITLNIQTPPPTPPANSMTNNCLALNNNLYQVQITYNNNSVINNAQQYQLTVGTSQGGNQILTQTTVPTGTPPNNNYTQSYTTGFQFTPGTTYYAQWAYATCTNCNNFSAFSPSLQFYCTNN